MITQKIFGKIMKLLIIILLSISTACVSQNYTYHNTYDVNEEFNNSTMKWENLTDSLGHTMVWSVFFEKTIGIIVFQDTVSKNWLSFKILDIENKEDKITGYYKYSYRCSTNTRHGDVYIYFYRGDDYSVVKVQYPELTIRLRVLIKK